MTIFINSYIPFKKVNTKLILFKVQCIGIQNFEMCCCIIGVVSNETNTDVRMYIWRIYSGRWSALLDVQVGTEIF